MGDGRTCTRKRGLDSGDKLDGLVRHSEQFAELRSNRLVRYTSGKQHVVAQVG
jgi:hypothetical protein